MNSERYAVRAESSLQHYEFYSEGAMGKIKKVIRFGLRRLNNIMCFNLSFGDWNPETNQLDDLAISGNNDTQKILATVAATVLFFTDLFPYMIVYAKGSSPARTRLYQIGIAANLQEIQEIFNVFGFKNNIWQPFKKGTTYEAFFVQ